MTTSTIATSLDEEAIFLRSGDEHCFGVWTRPTTTPNGIAAILLVGGLYGLSIGRNRLSVRLARTLASSGYHVMRLDLHGAGESTGEVRDLLDLTFLDDLAVAVSWIKARGIDQTIGVGSCFGGRVLLGGSASLPGLRGLVLASVPPSDEGMAARADQRSTSTRRGARWRRLFLLRVRSLRTRARARGSASPPPANVNPLSPLFAEPFADLMEQEVPLLVCFGDEPMRGDFERASTGPLAPGLARGGDRVEIHVEPQRLHGFVTLSAQDRLFDLIRGWFGRAGLPEISEEAESAWWADSGRAPSSGGE